MRSNVPEEGCNDLTSKEGFFLCAALAVHVTALWGSPTFLFSLLDTYQQEAMACVCVSVCEGGRE